MQLRKGVMLTGHPSNNNPKLLAHATLQKYWKNIPSHITPKTKTFVQLTTYRNSFSQMLDLHISEHQTVKIIPLDSHSIFEESDYFFSVLTTS